MIYLAFNGRTINWPRVCACCCRDADTSVKLDKTVEESSYNWFTRTTTTRYETRSWDVPYCKNCLAHIHEERAFQEFSPSATHMSCVVVVLGLLGWVVAAVAARGLGLQPAIYYMLLGFLFAVFLLVAWFTYPTCRDWHARELADIEARREELRQSVEAHACPACSSRGNLSVRYDGWQEKSHYGEWREEWQFFTFASDVFGELLLHVNSENCKRVQAPGYD